MLTPTPGKILVRREAAKETTKGGIVLPDAVREQPKYGSVLSVGSARLLPCGTPEPPCCAHGDRVLFGAYSGTEVDHDGETLLILDNADVLAVCK